jgi:hypothetical protein
MMPEPLPTLLDLLVVLAMLAWACCFLWRRYRPARGGLKGVCGSCRKCDP